LRRYDIVEANEWRPLTRRVGDHDSGMDLQKTPRRPRQWRASSSPRTASFLPLLGGSRSPQNREFFLSPAATYYRCWLSAGRPAPPVMRRLCNARIGCPTNFAPPTVIFDSSRPILPSITARRIERQRAAPSPTAPPSFPILRDRPALSQRSRNSEKAESLQRPPCVTPAAGGAAR
jgi:hypothetical protein